MDNNSDSFGELLHNFRIRSGLSQRELAEKAKIDNSLISRIERGERNVTRPLLQLFSKILNLSQEEEDLFFISGGFISPRMQNLASNGISKLINDIERILEEY